MSKDIYQQLVKELINIVFFVHAQYLLFIKIKYTFLFLEEKNCNAEYFCGIVRIISLIMFSQTLRKALTVMS